MILNLSYFSSSQILWYVTGQFHASATHGSKFQKFFFSNILSNIGRVCSKFSGNEKKNVVDPLVCKLQWSEVAWAFMPLFAGKNTKCISFDFFYEAYDFKCIYMFK